MTEPELDNDMPIEDDINSDVVEEFYTFAGALLNLDTEEKIVEACKSTTNVHLLTVALRLRNALALEDLASAIREVSGVAEFTLEDDVATESPQENESSTEELTEGDEESAPTVSE